METMDGAKRRRRSTAQNDLLHGLIDALMAALAFLWAAGGTAEGIGRFLHAPEMIFAALAFSVALLLFFSGFEMYSVALFRPKETFVTVLLSCLYALICAFLLNLLVFYNLSTAGFLLNGAAASFAGLLFWREALYFHYLRKKDKPKLLIIENASRDDARIRRMKYACLDKFQSWYEQVDAEHPEEMADFIRSEFPKYDAICLMDSIPIATRELIQRAIIEMNLEFYVVPAMYELSFSRVRLTLFDDVMVFHVNPDEIDRTAAFFKRALDLSLSACMLAILALPMALIALVVKLTSRGPVFYRQERLTRGKRSFQMIKFRTMIPDAERETGPVLAERDDPRVTPIGRFLRATRLDELPQLINVLKGEMSIVGPRPERPFFVEQYERQIPNYHQRFLVKAGMTSLSHVYGRYSTDIRDRTLYDLLYLKNYSLKLDLRIILLTTRIVCLREAAEGLARDPREFCAPS